MNGSRGTMLFALVLCACFSAAIPSFASSGISRGPSGCPLSAGLDDKVWICLTREEGQENKLRELDAKDREIDLRKEVSKLRAQVPSGVRRYVKPWATIGAEYLPNDSTYHPYGLAGVDFGRVSVWGGFFGSDPAAGVGWRF